MIKRILISQTPFIFILSFIFTNSLIAQKNVPWFTGQSRGEDLEIQLVTIDPGDELTMWWGHTAVIVKDRRFNMSKFYNYGLFSFEKDNFITNTAMGRLIFWVGSWNAIDALNYYQSLDREIRIQILNLSPQNRVDIAKFLAVNVLPENCEYIYDHYYDNCSTRVRDIFDKHLGGQFKKAAQNPSKLTFRDLTQCYSHHNFFMNWLLMFLMSDANDIPIKDWETMFLPYELERCVRDFHYTDNDSTIKPLVANEYIFYKSKGGQPILKNPPTSWPWGLLLGLLLASISLLITFGIINEKKRARVFFGIYHIIIGLMFGLPGLALAFMSTFTNHVVTYYNENLFLANPLTFLLFPFGIGILLNNKFTLKWLPKICYVLCASGLLLLILKVLPAFDQQNALSLSLILPVLIALGFCWFRISKKQKLQA